MKRLIAAGMAVLIMSGCAGCAAGTHPEQAAPPAQTVQTEPERAEDRPAPQTEAEPPVQPLAPAEQEHHEAPAADAAELPQTAAFLDEPYTIEADVEEIVSYSLTLPALTLASEEASAQANRIFTELADTLRAYAEGPVYDAARKTGRIGFLEGRYSIEAAQDALTVTYELTERYVSSQEETAQNYTHVYVLDAATGALRGEESR